ncbi:protein FAM98B-like protein [Lates japonicus]|uniref:Protein FAM98B-like protein n=1 Tax=Lates japonicus TaxID=270547 RepID=A0AAD3R6J5_LATJO|nr:protein FAM98B-like protein [Lates japonicus]
MAVRRGEEEAGWGCAASPLIKEPVAKALSKALFECFGIKVLLVSAGYMITLNYPTLPQPTQSPPLPAPRGLLSVR